MVDVKVNSKGIRNRLKAYNPSRSIAEFIWNGFDAGARLVSIDYVENELGQITELTILDDGSGIPFDAIDSKFVPVLSSEKNVGDIQHTLLHGKNGLGRLTFFKFCQSVTWHTNFQSDHDVIGYEISVNAESLDKYKNTTPLSIANGALGTKVAFHGLAIEMSTTLFQKEIFPYIVSEFAWYLEFNKDFGKMIKINGEFLDYSSIIREQVYFDTKIEGFDFSIRYVRWAKKLNRVFSRFYCSDNQGGFKYSKPTTLNNKGDGFYHSVFIFSDYFKGFIVDTSVDSNSPQMPLLTVCSDKSDVFKKLINEVNIFLRSKRMPYLASYAKDLVIDYESKGIFPKYNSRSRWESIRAEELRDAVCELYKIEPKLFTSLSPTQKKTFVALLGLVLDSGETDSLFTILENVIDLTASERDMLADHLKLTRLSSIIKTIEIIADRFKVVADLKRLVFDPNLYAGEVPHLQKMMERNYWLIDEGYQLLTAAEPDFEEALRRYSYILRGEKGKPKIAHADKNKEMDIFMMRQNILSGKVENIVLELKHPKNVKLGKPEIDQVYGYYSVIKSEPRFNASNYEWKFYLIGNQLHGSGYIEELWESNKIHGEQNLAYKGKYKIYVLTWSEIFNNFDLRHKYIDEKLKLERDKLVDLSDLASDIISLPRSSDLPTGVSVPHS